MTTHNFEFVKAADPEFYKLLSGMEAGIYDDVNFLTYARLALDYWCFAYLIRTENQTLETLTLAERLELLFNQTAFPDSLSDTLTKLRRLANQAVHIQINTKGEPCLSKPLEWPQKITFLRCFNDLAYYRISAKQGAFTPAPWQGYSKQDCDNLFSLAMQNDAAACAKLAAEIYKQYRSAGKKQPLYADDSRYWLTRALKLNSLQALQLLYTAVVDDKTRNFSAGELEQWILQYCENTQDAAGFVLAGRYYMHYAKPELAVIQYQRAAELGQHAAISFLLHYWQYRCQQQLQNTLVLGLHFDNPLAILISLQTLVLEYRQQPSDEITKKFRCLYLKAHVKRIEGLAYIEALATAYGCCNFQPDLQHAVTLLKDTPLLVPAFWCPAFYACKLLLEAGAEEQAVAIANQAMQQLKAKKHFKQLATLDCQIAELLMRRVREKRALKFNVTPVQLLKRAKLVYCTII